ncbi:MAG: CvpA family protein [Chloroflexota bacterium]|nr:CvpA family protein [Chloroflexota bacterium]
MDPSALAVPTPTIVDILIVLVILLYVLEDTRAGVVHGLLGLAGLLLALSTALLLHGRVAGWLVEHTGLAYALAKPAGFAAVWLLTGLVYGLIVRRPAAAAAEEAARSRVGRLLGVVSGAARGAVVVMLMLGIVRALPLPEPVTRAVGDSHLGSLLADRGADVQRALAGVFGEAAQETLATLTLRPESTERVSLRFRVAEPRVDEAAETRMLELVNQERARAGLSELTLDPTLREVARAYSAEMFRRGFFSHVGLDGETPFDRMRQGGARFMAAGENLALAPTVDVAHDGLMNSPGHRANILNGRFRRVGIGVTDGGMHGKMFVQNFAD